MFENELQTRAAICGSGLLLALIFLFAHLPPVLLVVPVVTQKMVYFLQQLWEFMFFM